MSLNERNKRTDEIINSIEINKPVQNAILRMTIMSAIQEAERALGKGHEMTCARASHLLGFHPNSKEAGMVLKLYQLDIHCYGEPRSY